MNERYFLDDDKFNRKQYADFLKSMIDNSEKYKRNTDGSSYVIAIDSSWGTGKTYFTDMFENYLLGYDGREEKNLNDCYAVVRFDAWKNDFWNNAFEPFVMSVLENDIFYENIEEGNAKSLMGNMLSAAVTITKGIVKKKLEDYIDGDALEKAVDEFSGGLKNFVLHDISVFGEYKKFKEEMEQFKEALTNLVTGKRKLVIIIDELDRCKPIFAIQLLEIVKHLFDIPGLTFIFMIDIEQLSHSVKTVYGHGMDATGYLCRFFDYITRMPKPSIKTYIETNLAEVELYADCNEEDKRLFFDFFEQICQEFVLSLRDIDTIIASYKMMLDVFLRKYLCIEAQGLYLFYLVLKYKEKDEFNNLFIKGIATDKMRIKEYKAIPGIRDSINNIMTPIHMIRYKVYSEYYEKGIVNGDGQIYKIVSVRGDEICLSRNPEPTSWGSTHKIKISSDVRINYILFEPDIKKWNEIKCLQYGQYIHQQLEMFNFIKNNTDDLKSSEKKNN